MICVTFLLKVLPMLKSSLSSSIFVKKITEIKKALTLIFINVQKRKLRYLIKIPTKENLMCFSA